MSINLQTKSETNIFEVQTEQASSIKFLLIWIYFEFPDSTAHFIGDTALANIRQEMCFIMPFLENFCQNFW